MKDAPMSDPTNLVGWIGIGLALALQSGAALIWKGKTDQRLKTLEENAEPIVKLRTDMASLSAKIDMLLDGPLDHFVRHRRPGS